MVAHGPVTVEPVLLMKSLMQTQLSEEPHGQPPFYLSCIPTNQVKIGESLP